MQQARRVSSPLNNRARLSEFPFRYQQRMDKNPNLQRSRQDGASLLLPSRPSDQTVRWISGPNCRLLLPPGTGTEDLQLTVY